MALVFQEGQALGQGIQQAGTALGQALQQRGQEFRKDERQLGLEARQEEQRLKLKGEKAEALKNQGTILQKILPKLSANSTPVQVAAALSEGMIEGLETENAQAVGTLFKSLQSKEGSLEGLLNMLGVPTQGMGGQQPAAPAVGQETDITTMSTEEPVVQGAPPSNRTAENPLSNLTDTQLVAMAGSNVSGAAALSKAEQARRDSSRKDFREDRSFAYKRAGPFLEKIDESRKTVRDQIEALNTMETAVNTENLEFFSPDNFASMLGKYGEGLRTSQGASLITAQKEFLVSDIGRVGPRPNQWIEQQISQALTRIGRSKEANQSVVDGLRSRIDRDNKRIEITDSLEEEYMRPPEQGGLGYMPGNISKLVDEKMKPFEEETQNRLAYRLRQNYEKENRKDLTSLMKKKVPVGTPLTLEMATLFMNKYGTEEKAEANARKLGYDILTPEEFRRYVRP